MNVKDLIEKIEKREKALLTIEEVAALFGWYEKNMISYASKLGNLSAVFPEGRRFCAFGILSLLKGEEK